VEIKNFFDILFKNMMSSIFENVPKKYFYLPRFAGANFTMQA